MNNYNHRGQPSPYDRMNSSVNNMPATPPENGHHPDHNISFDHEHGHSHGQNGHHQGQHLPNGHLNQPETYAKHWSISKSDKSNRHYFVNSATRKSTYDIPDEIATNAIELNKLSFNFTDISKFFADEFPLSSYANFNWEKFSILLKEVEKHCDSVEDKSLIMSMRSVLNMVTRAEHPKFINWPEFDEEENVNLNVRTRLE